MLFEIGCEKFSQGAVILENRILGCDLASLERNVFLVRKGKYSVVVLAAVAPWGFYLNIIIRV